MCVLNEKRERAQEMERGREVVWWLWSESLQGKAACRFLDFKQLWLIFDACLRSMPSCKRNPLPHNFKASVRIPLQRTANLSLSNMQLIQCKLVTQNMGTHEYFHHVYCHLWTEHSLFNIPVLWTYTATACIVCLTCIVCCAFMQRGNWCWKPVQTTSLTLNTWLFVLQPNQNEPIVLTRCKINWNSLTYTYCRGIRRQKRTLPKATLVIWL